MFNCTLHQKQLCFTLFLFQGFINLTLFLYKYNFYFECTLLQYHTQVYVQILQTYDQCIQDLSVQNDGLILHYTVAPPCA